MLDYSDLLSTNMTQFFIKRIFVVNSMGVIKSIIIIFSKNRSDHLEFFEERQNCNHYSEQRTGSYNDVTFFGPFLSVRLCGWLYDWLCNLFCLFYMFGWHCFFGRLCGWLYDWLCNLFCFFYMFGRLCILRYFLFEHWDIIIIYAIASVEFN